MYHITPIKKQNVSEIEAHNTRQLCQLQAYCELAIGLNGNRVPLI